MDSNENNFPRKGSTVYNINQPNSKTMRSFKSLNKFLMIPLYRLRILPLFGMGRLFLLLRTFGRKSGKKRQTPLEYLKIDDEYYIFASRGFKSDWLKNIKANPDKIHVQIGLRSKKAKARIITNTEKFNDIMKEYVKRRPKPAKVLFGWDPENDDIEQSDFSGIIDSLVAVQISPI